MINISYNITNTTLYYEKDKNKFNYIGFYIAIICMCILYYICCTKSKNEMTKNFEFGVRRANFNINRREQMQEAYRV